MGRALRAALRAGLSPVREEIPEKYAGMRAGASFTGTVTRCESEYAQRIADEP